MQIGPLVDSHPAPLPARIVLDGRYVTLEPLNAPAHAEALWQALQDPANDALWLYLADGPYRDRGVFAENIAKKAASGDPMFWAIAVEGEAVGYASLMRIDPAHRAIEVGNIMYSPALQRTAAATEAMYLLARYVFDGLGYRRYEWKCNSFNEPSRGAALRLGFTYEGLFRQHMILKGRNRDTAWFSMLDSEWPARKAEFERWLDPSNFDAQGQQLSQLKNSQFDELLP